MKNGLIGKTGAVLAILAMALQAHAAFTGDFAPTYWDPSPDGGSVQFINGDSQLQLLGPTTDMASSQQTADYKGPGNGGTPASGLISFDWAFTSGGNPASAVFAYLNSADNTTHTVTLASGIYGTPASGHYSVDLPAGSFFSFLLDTQSAIAGKPTSELLISNFTFVPEASTLWVGALLVGAFGLSVLRQVARQRKPMSCGRLFALLAVLGMLGMGASPAARAVTLGGVDLGNLPNYLFVFTDGSVDANWQGASKGFVGDVAVDGIQASERTSGFVPYAGTIYTSDSSLGAWQNIVNANPGQAFASVNQVSRITGLEADLASAFAQINALSATPGYTSVSATSLDGLNTENGVPEIFVINVTSGFNVSSQIQIRGDSTDVFILRWDADANFANGYQGQVKFQSGGAIVPLGGLRPSNFINVAGEIGSSGGGSTPVLPYPQGPRYDNGTGALINGAADFSGGGFFTGYWLTTGDPATGENQSLSNGIFVGGWYTTATKFSMTSGTSGVYVAPPPPVGCLGAATDLAIFGVDNGMVSINSATVVKGNVGYSKGVTSTVNQKIGEDYLGQWAGGAYVHSMVAAFSYTAKDYIPSEGIVQGGAADAFLDQANADALNAWNNWKALPPNITLGALGDNDSRTVNSVGSITVVEISSIAYNSDYIELVGRPGQDDAFIIIVTGNVDFSQSEVRLVNVRPERVVWVFPNPSSILINKDSTIWKGTILAPTSSVEYHNPATFEGAIIALNITLHSDFNLTHKPLDIPCLGTVTIGDFVWNDTNHDGIQDAGEPGIPGVTLSLSRTDNLGNPVTDTAVTDATGHYLFTELPGTYTVTVAAPAGYIASPTLQGPDRALDSNPNPSGTTPATLLAGERDLTIDFGFYQLEQPVTIGDFVWNDLNANGIQDAGEPGIPNVTLHLSGTDSQNNPVTGTTVTDASGHYLFTEPAGTYTVTVVPPAGYIPTLTGQGGDPTKDSNPSPSGTTPASLPPGGSDLTLDFGFYQPVTIGNFVWNDLNGNGVQDIGEPGIPNVTLHLSGTDNLGNPVTDTKITDGNGNYLFTEPPGTYTVSVVPPAGFTPTATGQGTPATDSNPSPSGTTPPALPPGGSDLTIDFGFYQPVTIGDFVWKDLNQNGIQDAGELGIPGVTLTLTGTDGAGNPVTQTTTTDASGHYLFTEPPGTYTVTVTPPAGFTASPTGAGTPGTDSNPNPSGTTPATLASGGSDLTIDFGFFEKPTLALLKSIRAYAQGNATYVEWQTASEVGTLAFDLYRLEGNQWVLVNPEPVLAENSITGAKYTVADARPALAAAAPVSLTAAKKVNPKLVTSNAATYLLMEWCMDGSTRQVGTYTLPILQEQPAAQPVRRIAQPVRIATP